jgi:hypothetical protein
VREHRLISTGLWLSAGTLGCVECADAPAGAQIQIQIGAHAQSLFVAPGPWHRWPSVCAGFALRPHSTTVCSQFGGIAYLAVQAGARGRLQLRFRNFSRHPVADTDRPELYEATRACPAPWAEFVTPFVILTLPAAALAGFPSFAAVRNTLQLHISALTRVLVYTIDRPFRLVFDVDTVPEVAAGYPAFLLVSEIQDLIGAAARPTAGMFRALMQFALSSFKEGFFDPDSERALAYFAVVLVFVEVYQFFDPLDRPPVEPPQLFGEIWHIHTKVSNTILPELFRRAQLPQAVLFEAPQEMWMNFLKEISDVAKMNFVPLFKDKKLVPLSLEVELGRLKPHKAS